MLSVAPMAPIAPIIMHHQAIHLPASSTGDWLITVNAFNPIKKAARDPSPAAPTNDSANPIDSILLSLTCLSKSERRSDGIFEFYSASSNFISPEILASRESAPQALRPCHCSSAGRGCRISPDSALWAYRSEPATGVRAPRVKDRCAPMRPRADR